MLGALEQYKDIEVLILSSNFLTIKLQRNVQQHVKLFQSCFKIVIAEVLYNTVLELAGCDKVNITDCQSFGDENRNKMSRKGVLACFALC